MALNIPTNCASLTAITERNAEYAGSPFTDAPGDGTFADPYLGVNRAGSNAPGIGIATGQVYLSAAQIVAGGVDQRPQEWTEEDQGENARIPQDSGLIGHIDESTDATKFDGFTPAVIPVTHTSFPGGTPDINNTANLVVADTAADDGDEMDGISGALNNTGATVGIGDLIWGQVPVT